jgi:hypothetical protein
MSGEREAASADRDIARSLAAVAEAMKAAAARAVEDQVRDLRLRGVR